ncbi:MAG: hypothetical protein GFH27_549293n126 [Chloroflexi bacterium AL-W]|nr:hypothetical protein [Chloroflexi bacterium AL-N1]NOK67759.1 hypothetical protein [Chloroflexi bacterium AL-N10]NOK75471.1 hypothetical protein [Chloroflexi bacterium AL-N5]NOK82259.1 hypothetical protein [Chloroflexi bacterium AL-W]NOK90104.1 hypothetical protein [Chloroflexi bacterium AL-N15]
MNEIADIGLASSTEIQALIEESGLVCLSLFLPPSENPSEGQKTAIRLENSLRRAAQLMALRGDHPSVLQKMLGPVRTLLDAQYLGQFYNSSLSLFVAPNTARIYRVPFVLEEMVVVDKRFYITPLLPLLNDDGEFYLLLLNLQDVKLLHGTHYHVDMLPLRDIPKSLEETLRFDDFTSESHVRPSMPGLRGISGIVYRGVTAPGDTMKAGILRYFQQIDYGVQQVLHTKQAPLILTGVQYLLSIYRKANTYPHLLEQDIMSNPNSLSIAELHMRGWALAAPLFQQTQKAALEQYQRYKTTHTRLVTNDLPTIISAAHHGRVDTLFVDTHYQQWGVFDPQTASVTMHTKANANDVELVNDAVCETMMHKGIVYAVDTAYDSDTIPLTAILRY